MTVGAPAVLGAHYVFDGGTWKSHGVGTHVPNPEPGQTTHLWDEDARTFGIPPLAPLPTMPTFYPDGATFTGPNVIYADQIAAAGDTFTQIVAKAKAQAPNASTLYTLVLSAKTYDVRGFSDGLNKISGVDMPPNIQIWGAGSGRHGGPVTTIRFLEHTSAYNITNCTWTGAYGTPKCQIFRMSKTLPGWGLRNVRVECGKQGTDNRGLGHPYNAVRLEECANQITVENVVIRGNRGYLTHPPGETGYISLHQCPKFTIRNIDMDGRELGNDSGAVSNRVSSAGIMVNESSGVIADISYHHSICGGAVPIWWSRDVTTFNVQCYEVGGGVDPTDGNTIQGGGLINHERVDRCSHYSGRATLNRIDRGLPSIAWSLNNDMLWNQTTGTTSTTTGIPGRILLVDPANDPTSDVYERVTVATWFPYDPMSEGAGHTQRNGATTQPAMAMTRRGAPVPLSSNNPDSSWVETKAVRSLP